MVLAGAELSAVGYNPALPKSANGELNCEHGVSTPFDANATIPYIVGEALSHQDECAHLHMTPSNNNTLSCMHPAGARDIVRRIPLEGKWPDQKHNPLPGQEYDFLSMSRTHGACPSPCASPPSPPHATS